MSKTFRFLIGPEREEFHLHAALVSHHSKPLGVLVNGQMKEAREGCGLLEEVDKHTFVRFCEYLYTGDYQPADFTIVLDESSVQCADVNQNPQEDSSEPKQSASRPITEDMIFSNPEPQVHERSIAEDEDPLGNWPRNTKKKASKAVEPLPPPPISKKTSLWKQFLQRGYNGQIPDFDARKNRESCEEYTDVFLSHARVYVFAEAYNVQQLRYVALQKLQRTLAGFTLYEERTGDITTLLRYVYENTAEHKHELDDLRSLVIHFAACNIETIAQDESFKNMLKEGGSIIGDLLYRLMQRLD